ncbi:hypothetical protein K6V92_12850 [Cupriavidus respiraculi]|uniref:hypothetical protein n=1 Tax=Cupriavidus respiraculi TaxID=195930 RepID=UPI001C94BC22|nr:hypothetical protein [Cupriavidus respiraculi]MBY4947506.1 hypothetical protein [Cupriavidus respiraculi]
MYKVYWTTFDESGAPSAHSQDFDSTELAAVLAWCEDLRAQQRAGKPVGFVTMVSENPNSVGNPGAADVEPGYAWYKRRPPPLL